MVIEGSLGHCWKWYTWTFPLAKSFIKLL